MRGLVITPNEIGFMSLQHHHHELTLGLSFLLGAAHALEPGHGKTALFVHLAGGPRGFWHPVVMGISTAVSHSVSLFAIALAVHVAHHMTAGDHHHEQAVSSTLQWVSALLVTGVGLWQLFCAVRRPQSACCHHHHADHHAKHSAHAHGGPCAPELISISPLEPSVPAPRGRLGTYSTTALLGIAVGLLPCPSALAAFFTGLSTGTPSQAYAIIALFGAGIAAALSVTGYLLRFLGTHFRSRVPRGSIVWGLARAGIILGIGIVHVARLTWS